MRFVECATCAAKPGSPTLCASCVANRAEISRLTTELDEKNKLITALRTGIDASAHDAAGLESRLSGLIAKIEASYHTNRVRSDG